jgi:hypothetical protein
MKTVLHNHLKGQTYVAPTVLNPFLKAIRGITADWDAETAPKIRGKVVAALQTEGWSKPVKLNAELGLTVTAMKEGIALSVQFGNMSRFYADLLKLQYLHQRNRAAAAIYVLPTQGSAKKIGDNIACFERLCRELTMFQEIIRIPILVVGLEE